MDAQTTQTSLNEPLYDTSVRPPAADAPLRDLPPNLRPVFQAIRNVCLQIPRSVEMIRHEGPVWKWIWAYERDGFTICVIHPMRDRVDLSFPLPTRFEPIYREAKLDETILKAISKGATAARVRYVRLNIPDVGAVPRLFSAVELKVKLMSDDTSNE